MNKSGKKFKVIAILVVGLFVLTVFSGISEQTNLQANPINNKSNQDAGIDLRSNNMPVMSNLPTTADLLWDRNDGYSVYHGGLAVDGDRLYVSPVGNSIMVYNLNGTNIYNITTTETSYPAFGAGQLYFGLPHNYLEAATLLTGSKVYTESIPGASTENNFNGYQTFVYSNECVYTTSYGSSDLTAFNSSVGTQEWQYVSHLSVSTEPTVGDYEVLVGFSNSNVISAINNTNGILNWNATLSSSPSASISFYNNTFFVPTLNNRLYAISDSGKILWNISMNTVSLRKTEEFNNTVYVSGMNGYLYAYNATTGKLNWDFLSGNDESIWSSPLIENNMLYFATANGMVYDINSTNGKLIWYYNIGEPIRSNLVISDNELVGLTEYGTLFAFGNNSSVNDKSSIFSPSANEYHGNYTHNGMYSSSGPNSIKNLIWTYDFGQGNTGMTATKYGLVLSSPGDCMGEADDYSLGFPVLNSTTGEVKELYTAPPQYSGWGWFVENKYIPTQAGISMYSVYYNDAPGYGIYGTGNAFYGDSPYNSAEHIGELQGTYTFNIYSGYFFATTGNYMKAYYLSSLGEFGSSGLGHAWAINTIGDISGNPTFNGSYIFVGYTNNNNVSAYNVLNGSLAWNTTINGDVSDGTAFSNNSIFFGTTAGYVYRVSSNGNILWYKNLSNATTTLNIGSTPTIYNNNVYVTASNGTLYDLSESNGNVVWSRNLTGGQAVSPVVSLNGILYTGSSNDILYFINATNGKIIDAKDLGSPLSSPPLLYKGFLYVSTKSGDVYAYAQKFNVNFKEKGLGTDTPWNVSVNGKQLSSISDTITFSEIPGTYSYSIVPPSGYTVIQNSTGDVSVTDKALTVNVAFAPIKYNVTFTDRNLPSGIKWFANITNEVNGSSYVMNSTGAKIIYSIPNGTYDYSIATNDKSYDPLIDKGSFKVAGSPVNIYVKFKSLEYNITFIESGLYNGTLWYVNLSNKESFSSNTNTISFMELNGTYNFNVSKTNQYKITENSSGTITISGNNQTVNVEYAPVLYRVTFTESGLTYRNRWYVNLTDGQSFNSTGTSISINEINGTYDYSITALNRYQITPSSGEINITGTDKAISITFKPFYKIIFSETGLNDGQTWYINLTTGASYQSSGDTIQFYETNATYYYSISTSDHIYSPTKSLGHFTVNGHSTSVSIKFNTVNYTITFEQHGLPYGTLWYVNLTNGMSYSSIHNNITISETNGTYYYYIATVNKTYYAPPGSVTVNGNSQTKVIDFEVMRYSTSFDEHGLPSNTEWEIIFTNGTYYTSTSNSITIMEENGTYDYEIMSYNSKYEPVLADRKVVVDGAPAFENVYFSPVKYNVIFTETGLPNSQWGLNISGSIYTSDNGTLSVYMSNGTYHYSIFLGNNIYTPSIATGTFTVNGSIVKEYVKFNPVNYTITFKETGLSSGTSWSVNFNGVNYSSTSNSIAVMEHNGTFNYTVNTISGYTVSPAHGTFNINGNVKQINITFTPVKKVTKSILPVISPLDSYIIMGVEAAGILALLVTVIRRR